MLTKSIANREATRYNNLDFYLNEGKSAYRPDVTIAQLASKDNYRYQGGILVTHFQEDGEGVVVYGRDIHSREECLFRARKLMLCANILGSARIVLRSFGQFGVKVPLLCNPYVYLPCINLRMLGKVDVERRTSTGQLAMFHDQGKTGRDVAMAGVFSYSSLMLFRIAQQVPLGYGDARKFLQYLTPAFTIAEIHQPDPGRPSNFLSLVKDNRFLTGDVLQANYVLSPQEVSDVRRRERLFIRTLLKLGCVALKRINPGYGASIHYAGCLPYSEDEKPLRLKPNGRLSMTKHVYVGDASGFRFLPAGV